MNVHFSNYGGVINKTTKGYSNFSIDENNVDEISNEIFESINSNLNEIDCEKILQKLITLLIGVQGEISKKFERYSCKAVANEIYHKEFEKIIKYFAESLQSIENVKFNLNQNHSH